MSYWQGLSTHIKKERFLGHQKYEDKGLCEKCKKKQNFSAYHEFNYDATQYRRYFLCEKCWELFHREVDY